MGFLLKPNFTETIVHYLSLPQDRAMEILKISNNNGRTVADLLTQHQGPILREILELLPEMHAELRQNVAPCCTIS